MINFFNNKRTRDLVRLEHLVLGTCSKEESNESADSNLEPLYLKKPLIRSLIKERRQERAILSELPILLESLILLVESGLGILPAIHRLLEAGRGEARSGEAGREETKNENARYYLGKVHELSMRGLPFGQALECVADSCPFPALRHFFLHLDIGANVGGKLGNSLRSLAQHSHQEWKLAVEARVRRLENMVVFPVFGSVIGLILLTAAVPLVPLLELKDKLDSAQAEQSGQGVNTNIEEVK